MICNGHTCTKSSIEKLLTIFFKIKVLMLKIGFKGHVVKIIKKNYLARFYLASKFRQHENMMLLAFRD